MDPAIGQHGVRAEFDAITRVRVDVDSISFPVVPTDTVLESGDSESWIATPPERTWMPFPLPDPWIFEFLITTPGASIETVPLMSRSESTVFAFVTRSAPDAVRFVPTGNACGGRPRRDRPPRPAPLTVTHSVTASSTHYGDGEVDTLGDGDLDTLGPTAGSRHTSVTAGPRHIRRRRSRHVRRRHGRHRDVGLHGRREDRRDPVVHRLIRAGRELTDDEYM